MKTSMYLVALLAGVMMSAIAPTPVVASPVGKVEICHHSDTGGIFRPLSVAAPAVSAHLDHGDGMPGGEVPGMAGYVFGDGCGVVPIGPVPGCYEHSSDSRADLLYLGPVDTANNVELSQSNNGTCLNPQGPQGFALVLADTLVEAQTNCASLNEGGVNWNTSLHNIGFVDFPPNAWLCYGTS
jgi:hypothetical protein